MIAVWLQHGIKEADNNQDKPLKRDQIFPIGGGVHIQQAELHELVILLVAAHLRNTFEKPECQQEKGCTIDHCRD